jgi:hypothetical protein
MYPGSKILLALATCLVLNACNGCGEQNFRSSQIQQAESGDYEFDSIDMIVVNKVPRGAFTYEIGLSRNGKKPIEYIWFAGEDPIHFDIQNAKIGERGTIHLLDRAKQDKKKLPRPNTEKPPVIGVVGEVYWEKRE